MGWQNEHSAVIMTMAHCSDCQVLLSVCWCSSEMTEFCQGCLSLLHPINHGRLVQKWNSTYTHMHTHPNLSHSFSSPLPHLCFFHLCKMVLFVVWTKLHNRKAKPLFTVYLICWAVATAIFVIFLWKPWKPTSEIMYFVW